MQADKIGKMKNILFLKLMQVESYYAKSIAENLLHSLLYTILQDLPKGLYTRRKHESFWVESFFIP